MRARSVVPALPALLALAVALGCSSSTEGAPPATGGPGSVTTVPTTRATTTLPSTSTTQDEANRCGSEQLTVSLGRAGAAAGTSYLPVVFTNEGPQACSLGGFPGVSFLAADGSQAGPAATRQGEPGDPITIPPTGAASALVEHSSPGLYPPETCGATITVTALRVYAPDTTVAVDLPFSGEACANDVGLLRVQPVVEGQSGQPG